MAVRGLGCPVRFSLTAGHRGDAPQGASLIEGLPATAVMADTAYDADYLRQKGLATEGTRVRVTAEKVMNPPRIDNIHIEVELPLALEERHREGVDRAVHRCLIHNTLMSPPKIEIVCSLEPRVVDNHLQNRGRGHRNCK